MGSLSQWGHRACGAGGDAGMWRYGELLGLKGIWEFLGLEGCFPKDRDVGHQCKPLLEEFWVLRDHHPPCPHHLPTISFLE